MWRYLVIVLVIFALAWGLYAWVNQSEVPTPLATKSTETTPTTIVPVTQNTELAVAKTKPVLSDDWIALNSWLDELYGLPPVENTEQMKTAAFVVSNLWFEKAHEAVEKLEQYNIPWERTSPFFYLFRYYFLHDIQLTNASTPIEFMAADYSLTISVKDLHESADELVQMKQLGETLNIFVTEEDAMEWFREFDEDYERLVKEALEKAE